MDPGAIPGRSTISPFEVSEEEIESGKRATITRARSIREGLEWLAKNNRVEKSEIPTLERRLELDLQRERSRGKNR